MPDAFIFSAARTPIGKFLGGLAELPAPQIGAIALREEPVNRRLLAGVALTVAGVIMLLARG